MDGSQHREALITDRVSERPQVKLRKLRDVRGRDLGYRFLAGALTSVVAGFLTIAFGPRVGGVMLAFPAILGASLTLIQEQEDRAHAREDARGAVMGGCALALFAATGALAFGRLPAGLVLVIASVTWLAGALIGYLIAWYR
jgi:hypothetical protein